MLADDIDEIDLAAPDDEFDDDDLMNDAEDELGDGDAADAVD